MHGCTPLINLHSLTCKSLFSFNILNFSYHILHTNIFSSKLGQFEFWMFNHSNRMSLAPEDGLQAYIHNIHDNWSSRDNFTCYTSNQFVFTCGMAYCPVLYMENHNSDASIETFLGMAGLNTCPEDIIKHLFSPPQHILANCQSEFES